MYLKYRKSQSHRLCNVNSLCNLDITLLVGERLFYITEWFECSEKGTRFLITSDDLPLCTDSKIYNIVMKLWW